MIKVNYYIEGFSNSKLFKFFKTKDQVEMFKSQNSNYIFE